MISRDIGSTVIFPRERHNRMGFSDNDNSISLPEWNEIENTVNAAKNDAVKDIENLGIVLNNENWLNIDVSQIEDSENLPIPDQDENYYETITTSLSNETLNMPSSEPSTEEAGLLSDINEDLHALSCLEDGTELELKNYSDHIQNKNIDYLENSPYVRVNSGNKQLIVKKTTLCWLLSTNGKKISSDRLERVKARQVEQKIAKKSTVQTLRRGDIYIGDWVVFHDSQKAENNLISFLKLGKVLAFKYLSGKPSQRQYSLNSAPVKDGKKGLGVLCCYYNICKDGKLILKGGRHDFTNIIKYICTTVEPVFKKDNLNNKYLSVEKELEFIIDAYLDDKNKNKSKTESESDSNDADFEEHDFEESNTESEESFEESYETDEKETDQKLDMNNAVILEKYYATYYDDNWYLGRVIKKNTDNNSKVKFLKSELDYYIWPKQDDIHDVDNLFLFYGPVSLTGCEPFNIKRVDKICIRKKYLDLKKSFSK